MLSLLKVLIGQIFGGPQLSLEVEKQPFRIKKGRMTKESNEINIHKVSIEQVRIN